jgi:hypothetical protein
MVTGRGRRMRHARGVDRQPLEHELRAYFAELGDRIVSAYLFGSTARGEEAKKIEHRRIARGRRRLQGQARLRKSNGQEGRIGV